MNDPVLASRVFGAYLAFSGLAFLVLMHKAPALLALFGLVDLAGAAWTLWALRAPAAAS